MSTTLPEPVKTKSLEEAINNLSYSGNSLAKRERCRYVTETNIPPCLTHERSCIESQIIINAYSEEIMAFDGNGYISIPNRKSIPMLNGGFKIPNGTVCIMQYEQVDYVENRRIECERQGQLGGSLKPYNVEVISFNGNELELGPVYIAEVDTVFYLRRDKDRAKLYHSKYQEEAALSDLKNNIANLTEDYPPGAIMLQVQSRTRRNSRIYYTDGIHIYSTLVLPMSDECITHGIDERLYVKIKGGAVLDVGRTNDVLTSDSEILFDNLDNKEIFDKVLNGNVEKIDVGGKDIWLCTNKSAISNIVRNKILSKLQSIPQFKKTIVQELEGKIEDITLENNKLRQQNEQLSLDLEKTNNQLNDWRNARRDNVEVRRCDLEEYKLIYQKDDIEDERKHKRDLADLKVKKEKLSVASDTISTTGVVVKTAAVVAPIAAAVTYTIKSKSKEEGLLFISKSFVQVSTGMFSIPVTLGILGVTAILVVSSRTVREFISDTVEAVVDTVKEVVSKVVDTVKSVVSSVCSAVSNVVGGICSFFGW